MSHPGSIVRRPIFGSRGNDTALVTHLKYEAERAQEIARHLSHDDAAETESVIAQIISETSIKEPLGLDFAAARHQPPKETANPDGTHRYEVMTVVPVVSGRQLLLMPPPYQSTANKIPGVLVQDSVEISRAFDTETVSAADIKNWRADTLNEFAEIVELINAEVTRHNDALDSLVRPLVMDRVAAAERLRTLRSDLGED